MRRLLPIVILISLLFALVDKALAQDAAPTTGVCQEVSERSWGFIECNLEAKVVFLIYRSAWVWNRVQSSGQHEDLLVSACTEANTVSEIILSDQGSLEYVTECALIARQ
jgi:hypothetical protein